MGEVLAWPFSAQKTLATSRFHEQLVAVRVVRRLLLGVLPSLKPLGEAPYSAETLDQEVVIEEYTTRFNRRTRILAKPL
jgi:hypothetical protein